MPRRCFDFVRNINVLLLLLLMPSVAEAQFVHSNTPSVRSLGMTLNGVWGALPVMTLGSDDSMLFSFDEMSHTYHRYFFRVTHCDANWKPSDLHSIDYLGGFNDVLIEDWENSVNTTNLYTRYSFTIPCENVSLLLSGNYRVEVFDDEAETDVPVALFEFSVVEPKVSVEASVSGDTDRTLNENEQQLSFKVGYSGYSISSPSSDIIPVVYQNRRRDNAVSGIVPTYITGSTLEYVHNDKLIFNAGNEYRRFELTDPNSPSMNVEEVFLHGDEYHALLYIDEKRCSRSNYTDENGRYFVNTLEGYGSPIEADYVYVHFALEAPFRTGGSYYLLGDLCNNEFSQFSKLDYDANEGYYHTTQLLKLGLYNYQYVWLPDNASTGETAHSEGDFFNTENEYLIYIYHREFGARYDKLIGISSIRSCLSF